MNNSPTLSVADDVTVLDASGAVLDLSGASLVFAILNKPATNDEEEKEREKTVSEMKSLLEPLPTETQAEVDAARASTTEPEAANEAAYELAAEVDTTSLPEILEANGWVSFQGRGLNRSHTVSSGPWNVSASNDAAAGKDGFATFESTWLDQVVGDITPVVNERTDAYGRRYFSFENGITNSVVVIVFEVQGRQMLKIGDVILPLEEFFSLQSCDLKGDDNTKIGGDSGNEDWRTRLSGRATNGRIPTHVECVFPSRTVKIPNVNTVIIMSILTHLSKVFGYSEPELTSVADVSVKNSSNLWWTLAGAFVSGLVYGAALVSQRFK